MTEIRRRKVPRDETVNKSRHRGQASVSGHKFRFYVLTGLIFTTCALGIYMDLVPLRKYYIHGTNLIDTLAVKVGLRSWVHSVVIDAGSTGSRILAYTFIVSESGDTLKLHRELFVELKPGLSAFANQPAASTKNLAALLERAKAVIPEEDWAKTPLSMKATAGLRLLPEHKADALLDQARGVLKESGFFVNDNSVAIMDGSDEGLFSWFTINFLLDRFGGSQGNTVAALDLGGGSTQVSFIPVDKSKATDKKYVHPITAFHQDLSVYTRSYLGLGLNEARKAMLQFNNTEYSFILKSDCINPIVKTKWKHGGLEYTVQGVDDVEYVQDGEGYKTPVARFERCEAVAKSLVKDMEQLPELNDREVYTFSYYYDRATESGLIDMNGGDLTVNDYIGAAKAKCKEPNVDQPFMCLDLTYISVLLRDGFGLNPSSKLKLVKSVDGHEVSWALGLAFHVLQNGL